MEQCLENAALPTRDSATPPKEGGGAKRIGLGADLLPLFLEVACWPDPPAQCLNPEIRVSTNPVATVKRNMAHLGSIAAQNLSKSYYFRGAAVNAPNAWVFVSLA